ncbi:CvfB family protein [Algibacillus agarilyticus]|uniref:CvfB family protein n=1 Tax=Algibacillus agarilyticus TaxID=2234133 RepID=UPI000DD0327C|nr:S1-like domain-containing RNA-binding protein [Algibacillus agarilyticus]
MATLGSFNTLTVIKSVEFGFYLDGQDLGDILLPNRYAPKDLQVDDQLDVFIFLDSEDRLIATTQRPRAAVGEFAFLNCVDVNSVGAFLDWGLPKDLMVPFSEQRQKMQPNNGYVVFVYIDKVDQRITATAKVNKHLAESGVGLQSGAEAKLLVAEKTDLGYKCIVNNHCWGMIFDNDLNGEQLKLGKRIKGFIQRVRPDGKVDLSLRKQGYETLGPLAEKILQALSENKGYMAISDKSSPDVIRSLFKCSKREFKMAIGSLYKSKKIELDKTFIRLL